MRTKSGTMTRHAASNLIYRRCGREILSHLLFVYLSASGLEVEKFALLRNTKLCLVIRLLEFKNPKRYHQDVYPPAACCTFASLNKQDYILE
jgi:hypothetical protein